MLRSVENKLQPPDYEWVAQVSLLRPGCFGQDICEEKPRSQKRDLGHPPNIRLRHFHLLRLAEDHRYFGRDANVALCID
jgi:hypothetical protein